RGGDLRVRVVTQDGRVLSLGPKDFAVPPRPVGKVTLPEEFAPNKTSFQRAVAQSLRAATLREDGIVGVASATDGSTAEDAAVSRHPVAACPDAEAHFTATRR